MHLLFRSPLLALCLMLCSAPTVYAKPYFDAATIPPTMIGPPFAPGGSEEKSEIETILKMQKHPDPADIAGALAEGPLQPELLVLAVDPGLTRAEYPELYRLLRKSGESVEALTHIAKNYWNNKRPYLVDSRVKNLIGPVNNPAYPSGHTSASYVWAHVLGMVLPDKRAAFIARANKIAEHRVLGGVHFPNDVVGGKELALLAIGALTQNAEFQANLATAKQEIAAKAAK